MKHNKFHAGRGKYLICKLLIKPEEFTVTGHPEKFLEGMMKQ